MPTRSLPARYPYFSGLNPHCRCHNLESGPRDEFGRTICERTCEMQRRWVLVAALAILIATQATGLDWKSQLAKKVVREAAREGIEEAVEDAAKDLAFDAALGAVPYRQQAVQRVGVGSAASAGIEAAMTAANVASRMDTALDAADAVKKANKARKAIKKIR